MGRKTEDGELILVQARVPKRAHLALKDLSKKDMRSLASYLRILIEKHVADHRKADR